MELEYLINNKQHFRRLRDAEKNPKYLEPSKAIESEVVENMLYADEPLHPIQQIRAMERLADYYENGEGIKGLDSCLYKGFAEELCLSAHFVLNVDAKYIRQESENMDIIFWKLPSLESPVNIYTVWGTQKFIKIETFSTVLNVPRVFMSCRTDEIKLRVTPYRKDDPIELSGLFSHPIMNEIKQYFCALEEYFFAQIDS